jgi:hypothetical protein
MFCPGWLQALEVAILLPAARLRARVAQQAPAGELSKPSLPNKLLPVSSPVLHLILAKQCFLFPIGMCKGTCFIWQHALYR